MIQQVIILFIVVAKFFLEALSKLCKIETTGKSDTSDAIITEEKHIFPKMDERMENTHHPPLLQITDSKIEELHHDLKDIDMSHMPVEHGSYNFDMSPLNPKYQSNLTDNDFLNSKTLHLLR